VASCSRGTARLSKRFAAGLSTPRFCAIPNYGVSELADASIRVGLVEVYPQIAAGPDRCDRLHSHAFARALQKTGMQMSLEILGKPKPQASMLFPSRGRPEKRGAVAYQVLTPV
jgi:hypothetical protein